MDTCFILFVHKIPHFGCTVCLSVARSGIFKFFPGDPKFRIKIVRDPKQKEEKNNMGSYVIHHHSIISQRYHF